MSKHIYKTTCKNFIQCGITGWCLEILWTGFLSMRRRDKKLTGATSIWMFPIYGAAAFFKPVVNILHRVPLLIRGTIYTFSIFVIEFFSGSLLKKHGCCPWDYSHADYNYKGIIRLDYAPLWFITGLLMEHKMCHHHDKS